MNARLAAEFQRHPLDRLRRGLGDPDPGLRRAGDADHVDAGVPASSSPISAPGPLTTFTVPGGRPSSSMISASTKAASGAAPAGLRIVVQPAASAGASFAASWYSG